MCRKPASGSAAPARTSGRRRDAGRRHAPDGPQDSAWPPRSAARLPVFRRLRVALFFTGDELVDARRAAAARRHLQLQPLRAARAARSARLRGARPRHRAGHLDATRAALREAAAGNDLIVTSGGVSVGEEDHVKPAVRPRARSTCGKSPSSRASRWPSAGAPAGGAARLHRPAGQSGVELRHLHHAGAALPAAPAGRRRLRLPRGLNDAADFDWPKADRRREFLRARINAEGGLDLFPTRAPAC
jgi:molybdopterin molybdotransferase